MANDTGLYYWSDGEQLLLFLSGRITANEAYALYQHVEPWQEEHPAGTIIADLDAAYYIDSTTIGTLIRLHKEQKRQGGRLVLCNLSDEVEDIIRKTKLLRYFMIIVDERLRSLEQDAFKQMEERHESLDSGFVLDAHNDICRVVPELRPRFESLLAVLAADQSRRNTSI